MSFLHCVLIDFHQTFVSSASWDKDELLGFWGQKVKGQGHSMTKYAKHTIDEGVQSLTLCILVVLAI